MTSETTDYFFCVEKGGMGRVGGEILQLLVLPTTFFIWISPILFA